MWHYSNGGVQQGPVGLAELEKLCREGVITANTSVWRPGWTDWLSILATDLAEQLHVPLPDGDTWEICAYSGDTCRRSEMVELGGHRVGAAYKDQAVELLHQGGQLPVASGKDNASGVVEFGHLLREGWHLLAKALPSLLPLWIGIQIIEQVLTHLVAGSLGFLAEEGGRFAAMVSIGNFVVVLILNNALNTLCVLQLDSVQAGAPLPLGRLLSRGGTFYFRLWLISVIVTIPMIIGCIAFVLPGLMILTRYAVADVACVRENLSAIDAMKRSEALMVSDFWSHLGRVSLAFVVFSFLPNAVVGFIKGFLNKLSADFPDFGFEIMHVIASLPSLMATAFLFCYFRELRYTERRMVQSS